MSESQVNHLLGVSMEKIKGMVDVNTVIGDPVTTPDGTMVIPVSSVKYGFAGGGSDLPTKAQAPSPNGLFAGGSGAAVTVTPVAFLVITGGQVKLLQIEPYTSSLDRVIEKVPDVVDKINELVSKGIEKAKKPEQAETDKNMAEEKPKQ